MESRDYGPNGIIDFSKLWEVMEKRGRNKQYLIDNGIHRSTLYKLVRNENVDIRTIATLCYLLNTQPKQIMEYIPPEKAVGTTTTE